MTSDSFAVSFAIFTALPRSGTYQTVSAYFRASFAKLSPSKALGLSGVTVNTAFAPGNKRRSIFSCSLSASTPIIYIISLFVKSFSIVSFRRFAAIGLCAPSMINNGSVCKTSYLPCQIVFAIPLCTASFVMG